MNRGDFSWMKYNCKVKIYPDGHVHLTTFSRNIFTDGDENLLPEDVLERMYAMQELEDEEKPAKEYDTNNTRLDSLRRAKGKIFDVALSNDWTYMITLTLDKEKVEDRYDPKAVVKPFKMWLNNMVKRRGLKYLIVPELHEDGGIHFHGLINDSLTMTWDDMVMIPTYDKPIKLSTAERNGYKLGDENVRKVYNIAEYKLGFSTAVKIDDNVEAVSKYMTKYTCKNFQKIFGKTFFAGGGINRDIPTRYIHLDFDFVPEQTFRLPAGLGSVKYSVLDENLFNLFFNHLGGSEFENQRYQDKLHSMYLDSLIKKSNERA